MREARLKRLMALLPAELEELLFGLEQHGVERRYLPGKEAPQAERVTELLRAVEARGLAGEVDAFLAGRQVGGGETLGNWRWAMLLGGLVLLGLGGLGWIVLRGSFAPVDPSRQQTVPVAPVPHTAVPPEHPMPPITAGPGAVVIQGNQVGGSVNINSTAIGEPAPAARRGNDKPDARHKDGPRDAR